MKKLLALPVLFVAVLALSAVGLADPGENGKSKGKKKTFAVITPDGGSCGEPWATDTLRRTFHVKDNGDGTYRLTRRDRGTFVTLGPASPGACDTDGKHGSTVVPGVKGKVHGFLVGTVTGGTYNPNATCPAATNCGFTRAFVTTFFGPAAKFTCLDGGGKCRYNYEYSSPAPNLKFRHWRNSGDETKEIFRGDIANA